MTAPADLVVTQLSVEAGEAQESADFVTVSRPTGLWPLRRRTDQFCALLAPDRLGQGALCRQVLDVMEREFAASGSRSATSALAAVLLAAHQFLRRENSLSLPEDRVRMQVAAAVLRSGGAYLGRIGPTFAAVRHRGTLQRFMGVPDTGGLDENEEVRPLGGELEPEIHYAFSPFAPDDLLVLASGPQWERLRPDYIEAAMDEGQPSAVASALYELAVWRQTRPTFSILVVEARTPERRGWMPRVANTPEDDEEDDYVEAAPRAHARSETRAYRQEGGRGYDYGDDVYASERRYPDEDDYDNLEPSRGGRRTATRRRRHGFENGYRSPGAGGAVERVRAGVGQVLGVTLATLPPRALLVTLMALALVVLVVLGFALVQILRPPPDQAAALAAGAQSLYDQARRNPDSPTSREQLDEARQLLTRALALRDDPTPRALLGDVQAELDRIDKVTRFPAATPLIDFASLGPQTSATRVIVEGTDVYVLDVGGARLLRYQLQADGTLQSSDPTVLVKQGDQVGGQEVGKLITMAWVGAGGPRTDPGLIVVDSRRTFLTYNPRAGLGRTMPADNGRWGGIAAMASFQGNVYLADPDRQTVMEYRPTRNGYDSPPVPPALDARAGLAWDKLVDLAADNSSLYVLQLDGALRKYARRENGDPQPFSGQVPGGLRGSIAMNEAGNGDTHPLYVADAGNERIVQLTSEGTFQRQFRAPLENTAMQGLRDVFVDPNNRLYVLTTRGLYRYDLPPE